MSASPSRLYLFDVDGTLVTARGAGREALGRALHRTFGRTGPIDRYDFRGTKWTMEFDRKAAAIQLSAEDGTKLRALWDVLAERLVKRGVPLKNLDTSKPVEPALGAARQSIAVTQGIGGDKAKEIVRYIKDAGLKKVQASIQGEAVRVTGPKRDDLQACIAALPSMKSESQASANTAGNATTNGRSRPPSATSPIAAAAMR